MLAHSSTDTDSAAPISDRLQDAVLLLRRRLEKHLDQESRLQHSFHDCQSRWSDQCTQMSGHLAMLEAHLSTWMQDWQPPPRLSVIEADS